MDELILRQCHDKDLDTLAIYNGQLIEDEGHDNNMTPKQLRDRMKNFISTDYLAYMFELDGVPVGYGLVNLKQKPYYLRHFFIARDFRRLGYGRKAFFKLLSALGIDSIDLEVLFNNERGLGFWKAMGFTERSIYMKYRGGK